MASSTLRMKVRTRLRRDLLTAVRAAILRVAFLAEGVLAITVLLASNRPIALKVAGVRNKMKSAAFDCRQVGRSIGERRRGVNIIWTLNARKTGPSDSSAPTHGVIPAKAG